MLVSPPFVLEISFLEEIFDQTKSVGQVVCGTVVEQIR